MYNEIMSTIIKKTIGIEYIKNEDEVLGLLGAVVATETASGSLYSLRTSRPPFARSIASFASMGIYSRV